MEYLFIIIYYLIGSINISIFISKYIHKVDIKTEGSGNPGSTNMLRVIGVLPAVITFLFDLFKGLTTYYSDNIILCMYAVIIGHIFPVFHGFKGGKGVATFFGCLIILSPFTALTLMVLFLFLLLSTKLSSLSSIICIILSPFILYYISDIFLELLPLVGLIVFKHKDNITRMLSGEEYKIL